MSVPTRDPQNRLTFTIPVRVYMEDTDAGGIVYYVNYLKYMERARTDMFRALGCEKPAVFSDSLMFVVHSVEAEYLQSAELDDVLTVSATIIRVAKATVIFEQRVARTDPGGQGERLLCRSKIKIACVSRQERKPKPMPAELLEMLK